MPVISAKHSMLIMSTLFCFDLCIPTFWVFPPARCAMQTSPLCDSALFIDRELHIPNMQSFTFPICSSNAFAANKSRSLLLFACCAPCGQLQGSHFSIKPS